jgi:hypothetical protein
MGAAGRGERGNGQQPAGDAGVREAEAPKNEISEPQLTELHAGDIEPEAIATPPPRDFRISEAHRIGQGGLKEKARDNIAAIRTLRLIEDEGREARDPEKAVLARYSGWGALSNVFHPYPRSDWEDIARDIRQLLTPEEYDSAMNAGLCRPLKKALRPTELQNRSP